MTTSQDTSATSVELFSSQTSVAYYYGSTSIEAALADEYFANGSLKGDATMMFTREDLGQRPHLMSADVSNDDLQSLSGPISLTFDGSDYSGDFDLAGAAGYSDAARLIQHALDAHRPTVATTTGDTIAPETATFMAYFRASQLYVTQLISGSIVIGGIVHGAGIDAGSASQIIETGSGSNHYHMFDEPAGSGTSPTEMMTETYGVLSVGGVTSGTVALGEQVIGDGLAANTAIDSQLNAHQWVIDNSQSMSESLTMEAAPLTVAWNGNNSALPGGGRNYFDVTPRSWYGYDNDPSSLSSAIGSGAEELGLTQSAGAILSSPGGFHGTMAQAMNNVIDNENGNFDTFQLLPNATQWTHFMDLWVQNGGAGYDFLPYTTSTPPAGSSGVDQQFH